ncbi:MAG: HD-GYP domain-containing protein [Chitinophagales bacterium]
MNQRVSAYITAVALGAAGLFVVALRLTPAGLGPGALPALGFLALVTAASLVPVQVATETKLTVETAIVFGGVLSLPLPLALGAVAAAGALSDAWLKRPWYNVLFNAAKLVVAAATAGLLVRALGGGPLVNLATLAPIVAGAAVYLLVDVGLVAGVGALHAGFRFTDHLVRLLKAVWFQYTALLMLGALASTIWVKAPIALGLLAIPLVLVHRSYAQQSRLQLQTKETLTLLADVVDARDFYTAGHCQRVATLSLEIARQLGLSEAERDTIYLAGRLHDIGKIGLRDDIALIDGPLSASEQAELERHPVLGMQMLTQLDQFFDVKEAVVFHHKRFDGQGYPREIALPSYGLPLSAAIIAVADAFDAMTSGRRYRVAFSDEVALHELRKNSGTQFHPDVVDALCALKGYAEYAADEAEAPWFSPAGREGAVFCG